MNPAPPVTNTFMQPSFSHPQSFLLAFRVSPACSLVNSTGVSPSTGVRPTLHGSPFAQAPASPTLRLGSGLTGLRKRGPCRSRRGAADHCARFHLVPPAPVPLRIEA